MTDIVTFLRARLDEDEVAAGYWHTDDCETHPDDAGYSYPCECGLPERSRADVEAKRRILELHEPYNRVGYIRECAVCSDPDGEPWWQVFPCDTVRNLTLPYTAHPDYDSSWVPGPRFRDKPADGPLACDGLTWKREWVKDTHDDNVWEFYDGRLMCGYHAGWAWREEQEGAARS